MTKKKLIKKTKRRVKKYKEEPVVWTTKDGRRLFVHDMETTHIRNAKAMLERSPIHRMTEEQLFEYVQKITLQRRITIRAFEAELARREKLSEH